MMLSSPLARAATTAVTFCALAVLPLVPVACSDSTLDSGLSLKVVVDAPSAPAHTGHDATVTTDRGVVVHITKAYLATESAELLPCTTSATTAAAALGALRKLFAIGVAHAHSTASPTRIGEPLVEDLLLAPGASTPLGVLAPPPARYCTLRYSVSAADDDAPGLPADGTVTGKSLHLEGDYALAVGAATTPFTIDATEAFDRDLTFDAVDLSSSGARTATVVVGKAMDHWFDGIDFAATSNDDRARAVLAHVRDSLTVSRR